MIHGCDYFVSIRLIPPAPLPSDTVQHPSHCGLIREAGCVLSVFRPMGDNDDSSFVAVINTGNGYLRSITMRKNDNKKQLSPRQVSWCHPGGSLTLPARSLPGSWWRAWLGMLWEYVRRSINCPQGCLVIFILTLEYHLEKP
jgi:hypothetical protein